MSQWYCNQTPETVDFISYASYAVFLFNNVFSYVFLLRVLDSVSVYSTWGFIHGGSCDERSAQDRIKVCSVINASFVHPARCCFPSHFSSFHHEIWLWSLSISISSVLHFTEQSVLSLITCSFRCACRWISLVARLSASGICFIVLYHLLQNPLCISLAPASYSHSGGGKPLNYGRITMHNLPTCPVYIITQISTLSG